MLPRWISALDELVQYVATEVEALVANERRWTSRKALHLGLRFRTERTLAHSLGHRSHQPRTWLMAIGWRRHGLIDPEEIPGASRTRPKLNTSAT
jgi:hypothetical protein